MQLLPQSFSISHPGRDAKALLEVDYAGGRTVIRRQHVGYPLHVTRGFYLDRDRPDLLTLYIQSASGGLYAGDRLHMSISAGPRSALSLTTQSSTVIHHGRQEGTAQTQIIDVGAGAFCSFVSDPYILFPGADLSVKTIASVEDSGVLIFADGFTTHDPSHQDKPFACFKSALKVIRPDGTLVMTDYGILKASDLRISGGQLDGKNSAATVTIIAPPERLPSAQALEAAAINCRCLAAASSAPGASGLVMRILGSDGGALAHGMEAAFYVAAEAATGAKLARRRK